MRLSTRLLGAAFCVLACPAVGDEPCSPRPIQPIHVPAFVPASPARPEAFESELDRQRRCLRWEMTVSPRAEFAPLFPQGQPEAPDPRGVAVLSSRTRTAASFGVSLLDPQAEPRGFTLGATLPATP